MSHKRPLRVLRRLFIGCMAIGIAGAVSVAPASFAQEPRVVVQHKSAETGDDAEKRQAHEEISNVDSSKSWAHMGAFVAEPIGRFRVGPEFVDGDSVYVRRTPEGQRITTVEASTTPFMAESFGVDGLNGRPEEQPAGW
jgi:hypothetical protein